MIYLRRIYLLLLIFSVMAALSCRRDDPEVSLLTITVEVRYPEGYQQSLAGGTEVTLRNNTSGETYTGQSGTDGIARFEGVVPGTYQISAALSLDAAQAQDLAGVTTPINLNQVRNNVALLPNTAADPVQITLSGTVAGNLLIKQVYYNGSRTPEGNTYFFDQFFEIYNNSGDTIYLDGLRISQVYGNSGQINPNSEVTPFQSDQSHIYVSSVWRIPGSGREHPLLPFRSIVVAQQGINHQEPVANPNSPVDLSNADWELFVTGSTRDVDAPNVPNLIMEYHPFNATYALFTVFGPGYAIWRTDNFEALQSVPIPGTDPDFPQPLQVPVGLVIDAVEMLRSAGDGSYKRIPPSLDAGFGHVQPDGSVFAYLGQGLIRKFRTLEGNPVLIDTNNSSEDFEVIQPPVPRRGQ